ncbi:glycosyltransferase family A protein [Pontibacter chitinilyticus]|uniref:glycosyltransferase family A protein n=1 Tax=Pontibacter chitinilyticus TaxID=2674989 RepID=UPI0032196AC6
MPATTLPLVSVVIAFLNEEKFLEEAITSVLHQEYTHWELLLVDDGSTDNSTAIARQYATMYKDQVFYCEHEHHQNKGLSASRNRGISQAKGELIALLDADDVWLSAKLAQQVAIFQRHPGIAMVAEASSYWYSWADASKKDVLIPVGAPQDKVFQPAELFNYLYPLNKGAAPCPSGLIMTKQAITNVGGFEESFTKKFQLYEDQAFLNKVYLKEQVYISSACNNLYRQRHGSIVQWVHADGQYHAVRQHFLEWFEAYLQQQQAEVPAVKQLLRQALHPYHHPTLYYLTDTFPARLRRIFKRIR